MHCNERGRPLATVYDDVSPLNPRDVTSICACDETERNTVEMEEFITSFAFSLPPRAAPFASSNAPAPPTDPSARPVSLVAPGTSFPAPVANFSIFASVPPMTHSPACFEGAWTHVARGNVIVFDTETSSLNGVVLQFAFVIATAVGDELYQYCSCWNIPEGFTIDPRAQAVHGITPAELNRVGVDPRPALVDFSHMCARARACGCALAAHNAQFDVARLRFTAAAWGAPRMCEDGVVCTMRRSRCGLKNRAGRHKPPRNDELFEFLFGRSPGVDLHDALNDARVTLASFSEGRRRKWW